MAAEIRVHDVAANEYRRARARYNRESLNVALRFDEALEEAFDQIATRPECGAVYANRFRWVKLRKYPFLIYYEIVSDVLIRVFAIAHERRRPGYWTRRRF